MTLTSEFQKSDLSNANGCVQVALRDGEVVVRDSKSVDGPTLTFTPDRWSEFLRGLIENRLDPVEED